MPDEARKQGWKQALEARLGSGTVQTDVPLGPFTTFQIGGPADLFLSARTPEQLVDAISAASELEIPRFLLGRGANILVADAGFRGLVIRNEVVGVEFSPGHRVRSGSGVLVFPDLIEATVERGLAGLHHFAGIPSTVGGAMWQNLHFLSPAPDRSRTMFIEEFVESAEILTEEGQTLQVDRAYFRFDYDFSVLHQRSDVVLAVTFALHPEEPALLRRVMKENLRWRAERHPDLETHPSAGSIFKKIEGIGAGRLIDECGLKGEIRGRAQIFQRHANIIVNLGNAKASDVLALVELAKSTVRRDLGYELETEILLVGEF